ncbi:uncharacterized protein JN550_004946 [Neoarthrinium moseri]|uniref:uncharacterized protein n=1 Tax=Neoarthrinium moseri TaxID=1658444 RepID=UPI001FDAD834|nr:uncharacterized protein JN550_004946 [Neoarthrinium moseri]KAI1870800.1 hypothetical protein JN550_004946 [Neoarthrinium moseri]
MSKPSVLIVGGGAFGTSTAFHLSHRGYASVTVLDRFNAPSTDAAATDLNKVIRFDYPNPLYTKLGREAMEAWVSPTSIFTGLFRKTGWIMSGHEMTTGWLSKAYDLAKKEKREGVRYLTAADIKQQWPAFTGEFPGWTNLWSPNAGWAASGQALLRMAKAAENNGVKYICGTAGQVIKLVYEEGGKCIGAITADGSLHRADIVILSAGAQTAALVEAKDEVEASASAVTVIALTPQEAEKYKDIPIIDDFEQGIIFPPDENGLLKLCSCRFVTNYKNKRSPGASIGQSHADYPHDGIPMEIDQELRVFLREMIPELADKPWLTTRMCWDGMSKDLNFRICPYPRTKNLYLASVGANHGFKFLPVIGKYVVDMLEGKLSPEYSELWSWKNGETPEQANNPHPYPVRELSDLQGWSQRHLAGSGKLPWTWSKL